MKFSTKLTVFIISFACIVGGYIVLSFQSQLRDSIIIEKISFQDVELPSSLHCSWCNGKQQLMVEWNYREHGAGWSKNYTTPAFIKNSEINVIEHFWEDKKKSNIIIVLLIDYKSPIIAKINYMWDDPKNIYKNIFWNFEYDQAKIIPPQWTFVNQNADDEAVRCGNGSGTICEGWFYHARYGQYYILIHSYLKMDMEDFEIIVDLLTIEFENYFE
jgi:hypothetical protein